MHLNFHGTAAMDQWLDDYAGPMYQGIDGPNFGQSWARIAKIGEEFGETIQAYIGVTGQNPRKGYEGELSDVFNELADTLITCLLAMQHFTKNEATTKRIIQNRWEYRLTVMHNAIATTEANRD